MTGLSCLGHSDLSGLQCPQLVSFVSRHESVHHRRPSSGTLKPPAGPRKQKNRFPLKVSPNFLLARSLRSLRTGFSRLWVRCHQDGGGRRPETQNETKEKTNV